VKVGNFWFLFFVENIQAFESIPYSFHYDFVRTDLYLKQLDIDKRKRVVIILIVAVELQAPGCFGPATFFHIALYRLNDAARVEQIINTQILRLGFKSLEYFCCVGDFIFLSFKFLALIVIVKGPSLLKVIQNRSFLLMLEWSLTDVFIVFAEMLKQLVI